MKTHTHTALILQGVAYTLIAEFFLWLIRRITIQRLKEQGRLK